jgi:beta-lactamase regulating signal transducer with metallopeptidase domain
MIWPELQTVAQIAVGRILNSLPEGLLIALFAGIILRLLPRQESGTRFALWFLALLSIAALPFMSAFAPARSYLIAGAVRPLVTLPSLLGLLIFLTWILAATIATLRLAVGLWHLRSLRRSCTAIDAAELDPAVQKTVADFRSLRSITLARSERISVPAAIGFFQPMIVLPAWALRELAPEELNIILLHEFAHLRRWDDWTNLLQKVVRALFLFHPAVWWIDHRLSLEREMACDDAVLAETANPRGYAKCLISLMERNFARRSWAMAQAVVHRAREASLRLARILDTSRQDVKQADDKRVWMPALGLLSAFSVVCLVILPQAPQWVAFEGNGRALHGPIERSDVVGSVAHSQLPLSGAAIIPTSMHAITALPPMGTNERRREAHKGRRNSLPPVAGNQLAEREPVSAGVVAPSSVMKTAIAEAKTEDSEIVQTNPGSANIVNAKANHHFVPMSETVLLIRTTQRVGQNSWVWSVSVWRLDWVNPDHVNPDRLIPIPNGTESGVLPKKT